MILVEIDNQNPLFSDRRTLEVLRGQAIRQGLCNSIYKTSLHRIRYSDDTSKVIIPFDGVFWPLHPYWYYETEVMTHLRIVKERRLRKKISTDRMKMFYDVVLHRFSHLQKTGMTDEQQKVWLEYGTKMLNHKKNCDWVEMVLKQGCISCSFVE